MDVTSTWRALQGKLGEGVVLKHVAGLRHAVVPERHCPLHAHRELEIVYHPTGRGVTAIEDGAPLDFEEGDVILYAPRVRHDQRVIEAGVDCCVQMELPKKLKLHGCLHVGRIEDAVLRGEIEYLSRRMAGETSTEAALLNLRATAVLLQLMELALVRREAVTKAERQVQAAERHVQENYARIASVGEIAVAVGLGGDYLRHLFRNLRGKSLVGYLGEVRLARAKVLLAHSNLPLKEVAPLCGYRDEYYFSAVFRRAEGVPPGVYREKTLRNGAG
ncbi:MAG: AraC family transcriptional regulator [Opitutaceae bacterium]